MVQKKHHQVSLNIVIPVFNEAADLEKSIRTLVEFLMKNMDDFAWTVTIVDNASVDDTLDISRKLSHDYQRVQVIHLLERGRGRAVKYAWELSNTDMVAYMDVDLSTDLRHFPSLVRSLSEGYDVAIGSRNAKGARVYGRNILRTVTSKAYILLIKCFFFVHFSDAQCGFKAMTRRMVKVLLPNTIDTEWFFDTELLILAEKLGYRIYEEPVTWIDNPGSTVKVWKTAFGDLCGLWRMFLTRPWRKQYE
ncbi:glycosyltransferase [Candidatus Gottesmanbacteria bacterium]|nr:glycosyltransferase [Candidatus Gottesmanbacteria bacterium]